jgi:predicted nucleic acid-binding protein
MADLVIDASAMIDLILGGELGDAVYRRIFGNELHAPAHIDAEVLSAFGRMNRAGSQSDQETLGNLNEFLGAPITRHAIGDLLIGAWSRRDNVSLKDAIYIELSQKLTMQIITTDKGMTSIRNAEVISVS